MAVPGLDQVVEYIKDNSFAAFASLLGFLGALEVIFNGFKRVASICRFVWKYISMPFRSSDKIRIPVYKREKDAINDITTCIKNLSSKPSHGVVKIVGARFSDLLKDDQPFKGFKLAILNFLASKTPSGMTVRFLLVHPESKWIDVRVNEPKADDSEDEYRETVDEYRKNVNEVIGKLESLGHSHPVFQKAEWRLYDNPITWRYMIIGDDIFVGSYLSYQRVKGGEYAPITRITKGRSEAQTSMYNFFERHFDVLFGQSEDPSSNECKVAQVNAVARVVESGEMKYRVGGKVDELEAKFAAYNRVEHAVCVFNGTVSIEVALRAAGVGPGDEVLVSAYDHPANLNAVMGIGARCRFVDVEDGRPNMDPVAAQAAIEKSMKEALPPKAIIVTHLDDLADIDAFEEMRGRFGIKVIYDAARAVGAEWKGIPVGSFGDMCAFSFEDSKHIRSGEGGAVTTSDLTLAKKLRACRNRGRDERGVFSDLGILGSNYRMTEVQAACLLPQLKNLEKQLDHRHRRKQTLCHYLGEICAFHVPATTRNITRSAPYNVMLRYEGGGRKSRGEAIGRLCEKGIQCGEGWLTPVEVLSATGSGGQDDLESFPNAKRMREQAFVLPGTMLDVAEEEMVEIAKKICQESLTW